jgi:hypothetical protein
LIICTWIWGESYGEHYVKYLANGIARNLKQDYRFICVTDRRRNFPQKIEQVWLLDPELTKFKGCFARLRLFDTAWQKKLGIKHGEKIVNLDLDLLVVGPVDDLFVGDDFAILQNINSTNPCPYNGSVWMFKAGMYEDVWLDFSLEEYANQKVPFHSFPDDQGWFNYKIPNAKAWGPDSGVYGFKKRGWSPKTANDSMTLPDNAKIVAFPGWRDPSKFMELDWVRNNWC